MTEQPLLRTTELRKSYGGVKALQGASLDVFVGEVHALLGENGTGKSTLMRVLAGVERPDDGVIELAGQPVVFHSAAQAREAGIGIVFQELSLFPDLDVLANLFIGREHVRYGRVDRKAMRDRALPVAQRLGLGFPLDTKVADLTLAERQLTEIAKALVSSAQLLIFDEPNSALNSHESAQLFKLIRELRDTNTAVIYISHRLEEVFALADRISVMRGGRIVVTEEVSKLSMSTVVEAMLGRKSVGSGKIGASKEISSPIVLRLQEVNVTGRLHDVSLELRRGEVVGLAGLEGAGQQDVLRVLFGDLPVDSGRMEIDGRAWHPAGPRDAARAGVAFVPADRTRAGLMMSRSIADNIAQVRMATSASAIYRVQDLVRGAERRVAELRIKSGTTREPVSALSGGNQQKVVLAKWLEIAPRVLLLDDPTRGVDVGGKAEIYDLIVGLADAGVSVLFASSEFIEYQLVCQRVLVFFAGRVVEEVDIADASEHLLAEAVNTEGRRALT